MTLFDIQCQLNKLQDCCHDDVQYVSTHIAGMPADDKKIAVNYLTGLIYYKDVNGLWKLYVPPVSPDDSLTLTTSGTSGPATYNPSTEVLNIPNYTPRIITVNGISPDQFGNILIAPPTVTGSTEIAYRALLSQSGLGDPIVTIQENTLGVTPTVTRVGVGVYHVTSAIFTITTTHYHIQSGQAFFSAVFLSPNTIEIRTDNSDDLLSYTPIEIKVYS